jgi:hypothetical protein
LKEYEVTYISNNEMSLVYLFLLMRIFFFIIIIIINITQITKRNHIYLICWSERSNLQHPKTNLKYITSALVFKKNTEFDLVL